jgi:DNA-binding response OmpR family regulator
MNTDRSVHPRFSPIARTTAAAQRILVAEDDEETRDVVVTAFLEEGHDVYGLDGEAGLTECLGIIARHRLRAPDLIAVGVRMAWHSGVDLVEEIRSAGWETPVVLMTWAAPRNARYVVERAGAVALVCKPFLVSELRSAARRARQQRRGPELARAVPATHPMARWSLP